MSSDHHPAAADAPPPPPPPPPPAFRVRQVWHELAPVRRQLAHEALVCAVESVGLALLVLSGGALFAYLEGGLEQQIKCGVRHQQLRFLDDLWGKSDTLDRKAWRALARKHLQGYEEQLLEAYTSGVTSPSGQRMWTIANGAVYAWTVVTTLGYGHLSPATTAGKAVSIVYAILGIPIFLIVLADYGKLFTRGLKFVMAAAYRLYHTKSCTRVRRAKPVENVVKGIQAVYDRTGLGGEDSPAAEGEGHAAVDGEEPQAVVEVDDEFNLPVSLALFILLSYLFIGAIMFVITEDWSYFNAFYFVFISMTTIGFGDLVPSVRREGVLGVERDEINQVACRLRTP
ncbi:TWiK family of potassium channels protein 7 [Amphibalanus amphitrite]|uniref:TWiK family of potassium channels protein 7 n=1 Tax=Amphibalanus amphitrite TaxID=1232801 RepID=A0A6A4XGD2_AMPAM|nr:TWiK family of potassium channels protein 7 [Amphibalanus amphitrite]